MQSLSCDAIMSGWHICSRLYANEISIGYQVANIKNTDVNTGEVVSHF